jgi:putative tricarboxylic transport membrane protein
MKKLDRWSSIFWLVLSIGVCIRAYQLGMGSMHNPGPGFLFFWCGVILGGLSLLVLVPAFKGPIPGGEKKAFGNVNWRKVVAVIAGLVGYGLLLEWIGFLISTALFIGFLLTSIEAKRWAVVITVALASTALTYLLFEILLQARLPRGFLGI